MREDRLDRMEQYIRNHKFVSLEDLSSEFNISMNTVRRDINVIVERSDIKKIYGGVKIEYNRIPPPFDERSALNQDIKEQIARKAAQLVEDGDIIYVDSGTTTCRLINYLGERKNITVITHSIDVINRAISNPELTLISLSGTLNRKTLSFTGQSTIDVLQTLNISKAFMAANGISVQNGATQSTSIEFAIKKSVVDRSDNVILMVENRKFGAVSLLTYCPLNKINYIVTDKAPLPEFSDAFLAMNGKILTP